MIIIYNDEIYTQEMAKSDILSNIGLTISKPNIEGEKDTNPNTRKSFSVYVDGADGEKRIYFTTENKGHKETAIYTIEEIDICAEIALKHIENGLKTLPKGN